jgi:copper homeostasis protein
VLCDVEERHVRKFEDWMLSACRSQTKLRQSFSVSEFLHLNFTSFSHLGTIDCVTMFLEVACFNADSALVASEAGADRIELCDNADLGGTTPPFKWLSEIEHKVNIPVNVMIRPRGGDFVYTDQEFESMKAAINTFNSSPIVSGFVFGILKHDRTVDVERNTRLVEVAAPLSCTFHRALDETQDPVEALEDVIRCGFKTILTSGGASTAAQGCRTLAGLVKNGDKRILVMLGGGVRSTNIDMLRTETGAVFYHSSALVGTEKIASDQEIRQLRLKMQQER